MKIDILKLVYYSPTRTTKRVLGGIAEGIKNGALEQIDLTSPDAGSYNFHGGLTIIGAPVYGGRIPKIAEDRLKRLKAEEALAVVVTVYGNRAFEDALLELRDLAVEAGFKPIAGGAFIGEHSLSNKDTPIAPGRPDEADIEKAKEFGRKIKEKVETISSTIDVEPINVPGNYPYRERGKRSEPIAPKTREDLCTKCGRCAEVCPTTAVSMEDTVTTREEDCTLCHACVKNCPTGARVMEHPLVKKAAQRLATQYSKRREPEIFF